MTKAVLNKMSQDLNVMLQYTIYVFNILASWQQNKIKHQHIIDQIPLLILQPKCRDDSEIICSESSATWIWCLNV